MSATTTPFSYIAVSKDVSGSSYNTKTVDGSVQIKFILDQLAFVTFNTIPVGILLQRDGYVHIQSTFEQTPLITYVERAKLFEPPFPADINTDITLYGYIEVHRGEFYPPGSITIPYTYQGKGQTRLVAVKFIVEWIGETLQSGGVEPNNITRISRISIDIIQANNTYFPAGYSVSIPRMSFNFFENGQVNTITHDVKPIALDPTVTPDLVDILTSTPDDYRPVG